MNRLDEEIRNHWKNCDTLKQGQLDRFYRKERVFFLIWFSLPIEVNGEFNILFWHSIEKLLV